MKCKDFEREIYLYHELTAAEQEVVKNHLAACAKCRETFAMVQGTEALVSNAAHVKSQPRNAGRLTSDIMQAVAGLEEQPVSWFNNLFVRYAMTTASFLLIIAFGVESSSTNELPVNQYSIKKTVILSSVSFQELYRSKKEKSSTSIYACVKSGQCNTFIENFKKEL